MIVHAPDAATPWRRRTLRRIRRALLPLLAVGALYPGARHVWARLHASATIAVPGASYPERFAAIRPHLAGVRAVSYVFDPADFVTVDVAAADAAAAARARRATFEMFLAQRALAPTFVRPDPDASWILVNYRDRASVPADWVDRGLDLVADPGNGAVLFRLKGK